MSLIVIQDSREPDAALEPRAAFRPYVLVKGEVARIPLERRKLDTGDYSLTGLESVVCFERKTLSDLLGTLFGTGKNSVGEAAANRDRFTAELERMRPFAFKAIVVEASMRDVFRGVYRSNIAPQSVIGSVLAIHSDFGVPTIWAGDRAGAEYTVGWSLARIHEQHVGGGAAKKARARGCAEHLAWMGDS